MNLRKSNEADPVRRYSSGDQLAAVDATTRDNIRRYAESPPDVIASRIAQLRSEWSIERYLQLNAAGVGLTTALLAATHNRKWGYVTCAALAFLFLHAVDGFDPALPLLRQRGIRTRAEIDREIYALKALRGDFDGIAPLEPEQHPPSISQAADAVGA